MYLSWPPSRLFAGGADEANERGATEKEDGGGKEESRDCSA